MKTLLIATTLTLIALPSFASELPPRPKDPSKTYDNCFGTGTYVNGKVKLGIWADGKYLCESVESARSDCAKGAGKAGTKYAAKQIEKTCLREIQLEPES